ncbi:Long-chain-fatty-acid--CoA ligase [Lentzea sp. NPDC060358]|uniref:Long-chain-fatty-acid--CoA ligase n=1 Tax=Lentzea sp. NPDC060358 TaxID=3347103 RepID=UPI00365E454C
MEIVPNGERPDLQGDAQAALRDGWPAFVLRDPVSGRCRDAVAEYFPDFDVLLLEDDVVLARATAVALRWDGRTSALPEGGYDGALLTSVAEHESGVVPDTLCIVAATVRADRTGGGLAGKVLAALRERAAAAGLERVVVPVRPSSKARHPATSMEDFARWTREDGLHLDPWIRTHQRLGASVLAPAPRSMVVTGSVAQWESWTGAVFPRTGRYVVEGGLDLVAIDRERDLGVYEETNLWMRHR